MTGQQAILKHYLEAEPRPPYAQADDRGEKRTAGEMLAEPEAEPPFGVRSMFIFQWDDKGLHLVICKFCSRPGNPYVLFANELERHLFSSHSEWLQEDCAPYASRTVAQPSRKSAEPSEAPQCWLSQRCSSYLVGLNERSVANTKVLEDGSAMGDGSAMSAEQEPDSIGSLHACSTMLAHGGLSFSPAEMHGFYLRDGPRHLVQQITQSQLDALWSQPSGSARNPMESDSSHEGITETDEEEEEEGMDLE